MTKYHDVSQVRHASCVSHAIRISAPERAIFRHHIAQQQQRAPHKTNDKSLVPFLCCAARDVRVISEYEWITAYVCM